MEDFKSSLVGKSCNLKDEIKKLPEVPRKLWINRKFTSFLDKFKDIISKVPTGKNQKTATSIVFQDKINPFLPFLSELGCSFDNKVHKRIRECYEGLAKLCNDLVRLPGELSRSVASSSNKYLLNILCSERELFCTDDFMKQHLRFISHRWQDQTLKVEKEFKSHEQRDLSVSRFYGHVYDLQQIALDFLDKSYIYPLSDTTFPSRPGVYLIYHVGKTQLYEGSQVSPSTYYPVYVGMSKKSISRRLNVHRNNIKKANGEQTGRDKQTEKRTTTEEEHTDEKGQTKEEHTDDEGQTKEEHTDDERQTKEEHTDDEGQTKDEHTDEKEQTKEEHTDDEGQTKEEHKDEKEQTKEEHTDEEGQREKEMTERGTQTEEKQTEGKELSENQQTEGVKMELSDFVVRFMIVDIEDYARCIERVLIEYFCPVWNSESAVTLSFGNAYNPNNNNNWRKYHIKKDAATITRILDLLKICP